MGICNVTPDSFVDSSRFATKDRAIAHLEDMLLEGADILDIGGESTRPGATPVSAEEQLERILPVVEWASSRACISIDTTSAEVAAACLDAGAHAINDVSMLSDHELAKVTMASGAALIASHARAPQTTMKGFGGWPMSAYGDIVADVVADFRRATEGLPSEMLVMDPGLGFSKASRHSLELLRRAREVVAAAGVPVLYGASRKSFLTLVDDRAVPADRLGASVLAAVHAVRCGVNIVRVHDVRTTKQALALDVVLGTPPGHAGGV